MADLKADLKKPLLPPRRPPVPTIIPPQPPPVGGLSAALPGPPQAQFRLGGKPPPAPAPSAAPLSPRLSPLLTPHFTGTAASRDLGSASSASGSIASGGTGTSAVTNGLRGGGGGGLGGAGGVGGGFGGAGAPPPPPVGPKKKRGQGVRSWIRIDPSGEVSILEVDKGTLMRRCDLPGRDLRLLDPVFVYPSTILGRERAMVVNLESIRCIITADEVLLLNVTDPAVQQFKQALQRRLLLGMSAPSDFRVLWGTERPGENGFTLDAPNASIQRREISSEDMFSGSGSTAEEDDLPFEFKALELALELSCSGLDRQAQELAQEAYPLLERLAFQISTTNLELVRRIKSSLLGLTRRVQKVRDEIEQLMDDDGDMAEMYLTQKRLLAEERSESERLGGHRDDGSDHSHTPRESLGGFGSSISAPVSPAGSPTKHTPRLASHQPPFNNYQERHCLDGQPSGMGAAPSLISFWSGAHSASDSTATSVENVEELEMLLEAYFVVIDGTLNKLTPTPSFFPFPLPSPSHIEPQGSHYLDGRPSGLGGAPPSISFWSGAHSASDSTATSVENVEELEMLLEAYFVVIDGTLNKLTQLSQYIDDTEDFINIQLDNVRNQLIQFELIMTTAGALPPLPLPTPLPSTHSPSLASLASGTGEEGGWAVQEGHVDSSTVPGLCKHSPLPASLPTPVSCCPLQSHLSTSSHPLAGFVVALWGVIAGTFGMNVPLGLEEDQSALKWILIDSGVGGVLIFLAFLAFFRYKNWTIT
ncbi:unnamed protein product [Closterium sp. Naga37s-1]|nr:unnamed protein product [Closterium sp. Naga37s-1]